MGPVLIIFLVCVIEYCKGLSGPNVCSETQNYTITSRVKYLEPISVRTYSWCLNIPPRCSSVHTEMREKWKVQTEYKAKLLQFCCIGFEEDDDRCVPKCPEGLAGDNCDKDCPPGKWGPSCYRDCRCPEKSTCDPKNGRCVCYDDWMGPNCDVSKEIYTRRPSFQSNSSKSVKPLFDWSTPILTLTPRPKVAETIPISTSTTAKTTTTTIKTTTKDTKETTTFLDSSSTSTWSIIGQSTVDFYTTKKDTNASQKITIQRTTTPLTTSKTSEVATTLKSIPTTHRIKHPDMRNISDQIESPPTTPTPVDDKDSPIIVISNKGSPKLNKDTKAAPGTTESSIISLTVLKSTAVTRKKPPKQARPKQDSELVKITINSGGGNDKTWTTTSSSHKNHTRQRMDSGKNQTKYSGAIRPSNVASVTLPTVDNNTLFTSVTTDIQTEEIKHVLTEPEQITSVAGEEDGEERREDIYSTLSMALGVAAALILVATIIVLVARYRRGINNGTRKMGVNHVQSMLDVSEDELPSSYIRSVFHSPLPDLPFGPSYIRDDKAKYGVPFMQPVVIHAVSPILMENFRDILESHYDHPKPLHSLSVSNSPKSEHGNTAFGSGTSTFTGQSQMTTFKATDSEVRTHDHCLPVTEEAISILKREHGENNRATDTERIEHLYDEIPWPSTQTGPKVNEEAVTEL